MQKLEPLKSMIQFPKLENLPADFLTQMEEYVKEAPKKVDTTAGAVQPKVSWPTITLSQCLYMPYLIVFKIHHARPGTNNVQCNMFFGNALGFRILVDTDHICHVMSVEPSLTACQPHVSAPAE